MVPYSDVLAGRDPQAVITETPSRLAGVLDRLTTEQIKTPTAPGKWSVREVMAHMADCEIAWGWRLRQAYAGNHVIQLFEQDLWARSYNAYTYAAARSTFEALRAWNIAFIAALSEEDRRQRVDHPERGAERLWTLVEIMAGHDLHHVRRLEELFAA
ncbi:MAG TPA: DinB family protein [Acidobacteriaceae bacterium]|nr:DinB family protein [Acidobacteriaceae bacterium]